MAEEKRSDQKKTGELTRSLPRNYRQIGEPGAKKIYIEDYVYTYLNKLAQPEIFMQEAQFYLEKCTRHQLENVSL